VAANGAVEVMAVAVGAVAVTAVAAGKQRTGR
jgi:hypothetical protein